MNNIPTAEEFIEQYATWSVQDSPDTMTTVIDRADCLEAMKEFAQLHVEAALKAAAEKGEITHNGYDWIVDEKSIINTYPKENIK